MELIRDGSIHVSLARGPYLATSQFKGMGYFALLQGLSICKQLYRLPVLAFRNVCLTALKKISQ